MAKTSRNIIITGGGSGIGMETAIKFANNGDNIIITGRTESKLIEVSKNIKQNNGHCTYYVGDVANPVFVEKTVDDVIKKHRKIDILMNNAGHSSKNRNTQNTELEDIVNVFPVDSGKLVGNATDRPDLKEKLAGDLKEIDDKALLEKRKKEAEQKKIAKLAKEQKSAQDIDLKQKKKKEELKKKQLAKKKEQQKKREELKKKNLAKKLEREKKQKLKKAEQEKKKIAKLEEKKKSKESKIKLEENVNSNPKIVLLLKSIVKSELLPDVNPSAEIDFEIHNENELDKNSLKNLFASNSNLTLIFAKDFNFSSSIFFLDLIFVSLILFIINEISSKPSTNSIIMAMPAKLTPK